MYGLFVFIPYATLVFCTHHRLFMCMMSLLRKEYHVCLRNQARKHCVHVHILSVQLILQVDTQVGTMPATLEE